MQNNESAIRFTWFSLALIAIFSLGIFLRLFMLDYMAFHHDESIHAYYAHTIYKGNLEAYKYDPVYHGPFLYHYGALFFLLFGDSDFTARLPFVSFGILLMYFVWRLYPWIGKTSAFFCLTFVAISPTITYFSRFARNDVYMSAMAMGIILYALHYLRYRQGKYLVYMTFWLALMYSTKENSYMTGFFLGSFIVFYGIYYFFSYPPQARRNALREIFVDRGSFVKILVLYAIYSCTAFTLVYYVVQQFQLTPQQTHNINNLRNAWTNYISTHSWVVPLWSILAIVAVVGLYVALAFVRRAANYEPSGSLFTRIAKNNVWVLASIFVALLVYSILFTTMGTNPNGMRAGMVDYLLYWMGQQGTPRIAGPPDYFLPRLLIYEFAAVIFGITAFLIYVYRGLGWFFGINFFIAFCGLVAAYWNVFLAKNVALFPGGLLIALIPVIIAAAAAFSKNLIMEYLKKDSDLENAEYYEDYRNESKRPYLYPDGFRVFLIYWSVCSILVYAMLNEKVPWLIVHQSLPLILLAGVFMGDLWKRINSDFLRYAYAGLVVLFGLYQLKVSVGMNFYRPDDPRELLVYTQTSHEVKTIVEQVREAAYKLGTEYRPPNPKKPIMYLSGTAVWPWSWYLRNYRYESDGGNDFNPPPSQDVPFVITDMNFDDRLKVWAKGDYYKRVVPHRMWWHYLDASGSSFGIEFPFSYYKSRGQSDQAWSAFWRYILYRDIWGTLGSSNVLLYTKQPLIENVEKPEVPEGYEQAPQPLSIVKTVGQRGSGPAQFNEPRGVALTPDESMLLVVDSKNGRIQVFDRELNYLTAFASPGTGPGEFSIQQNGPNGGIDVGPENRIFVTDTWDSGGGKINRYGSSGEPLAPLTRPTPQFFYFPRGLAALPDGRVYISDTGNHEIVQFNVDGSYMGKVNLIQYSPGGMSSPVALSEPVGITDGPNGDLYVCDVGNKRVIQFNQQGQVIRTWNILGWSAQDPAGLPWIEPYVAVDKNGFVYVTDSSNNVIHCFDPNSNDVLVLGESRGGTKQLNGPRGIVVDSQGFMYIADTLNHRIVKARIPQRR